MYRMTKFIMLMEGRVGSSHVVQLLNNHENIICDYEKLYGLDDEAQKAKIAEMFSANAPVVGFKTKLRDVIDQDYLFDLIERDTVFTICLHRKNIIKSVVSTFYAQKLRQETGHYNRLKINTAVFEPIPLAYPDFEAHLRIRKAIDEQLIAFYDKLTAPKTLVFYEDLMLDEETFMRNLIDFLGLEWQPLTRSIYAKTISDDLRDIIENFDELRSHYIGTPYEAMFDEVLS
ncbi:MAG: hypothetical protein JXD22_16995 [Sedimentisphaerales bacterium]|nr:hypothetical protein [Sedimentisphaerales bacterium]